MQKLAWAIAPAVFLLFFGIYSFRLGIQPALMHDDFEYTYPSFSMAERGNFGSPLLGPGLNIENRTYNLIVYYYASVHALLIRAFGDGPESVPLANTFHFALLAAAGTFFLFRREAYLGLLVFLLALVSDERMIDAARHGRPEMTAGCCLTLALIFLWIWRGEGRHRPLVLFGLGAALTAGLLSHTSLVFFTLALALVFAASLVREAGPRGVWVGLLPFSVVPVLYGYFILTDGVTNLQGQLALAAGNVLLGRMLLPLVEGDWIAFASQASGFVQEHGRPLALWLVVLVALVLPTAVASPLARGARFFAGVYCIFFLVNFLCLKHHVLSYRVIYQATLYLAFALLAEALLNALARWVRQPWIRGLRVAGIAMLAVLSVATVMRFREGLAGQSPPFGRLQGALTYALLQSGARLGDRVFVPSPFGFHLKRKFDVIAYPAPMYFRGRWSPAFRDGVREVWGALTLERVNSESLCYAMGLAFIRPIWVLAWDADYSSVLPFYQFLRKYPDIPGMQVTRAVRARLPAPYSGTVRAYRLEYSEAISALDRTLYPGQTSCP